MTKIVALALVFALTSFTPYLYADEITLANGDTITGTITGEKDGTYIINTQILGTLTIKKGFIKAVTDPAREKVKEKEPALETPAITWTRGIEAGYAVTDGNTDTENITFEACINRNHHKVNETTVKAIWQEESSDNMMITQKWYTLGRFAYSFGKASKWYHFVKNELDHDKFADIEYRVIPATGIGYWYSDMMPFKAMVECALGYEQTEYYVSTEDKGQVVLIPRAYIAWDIWKHTSLSEEFTAYPLLSDFGDYRFVSKLTLSNKLNEHLALKVALINKYNSLASSPTKKHDTELRTSLAYTF